MDMKIKATDSESKLYSSVSWLVINWDMTTYLTVLFKV